MTSATCPECGATNPAGARWCGQCYVSLVDEPAPDTAEVRAEDSVSVADTAGATPGQRPLRPGFRRRGDTVEWECVRCGEFSPVEVFDCQVCGTPLSARFEQPTDQKEHNWVAALALSAVLPGAGHIAVGRYGSGVARALLFSLWIVGAVLLGAEGGGRAVAATSPLYLGALVLWVASLIDVRQLQQGDRELLGGRTLLWLVIGVIVLSTFGMFAVTGTPTP